MAHKKGLGSSRNGRDSNAKRLGVKVFAGQTVSGGEGMYLGIGMLVAKQQTDGQRTGAGRLRKTNPHFSRILFSHLALTV